MIEIVKQNTAKVKYLYTHSELFFLHHSCNKIAQQMGGYALDMYCFGIYPCMSVLLITLNIPLRITEIPSFWLPECFTLYMFMDRADSRPYQENFSYWIITSLFHFTYVVFLWWNSFDYKATYAAKQPLKNIRKPFQLILFLNYTTTAMIKHRFGDNFNTFVVVVWNFACNYEFQVPSRFELFLCYWWFEYSGYFCLKTWTDVTFRHLRVRLSHKFDT